VFRSHLIKKDRWRLPFFSFLLKPKLTPFSIKKWCQQLASGLIARNDRGEVLASQATLEEAIASPFFAEACACTRAVRLGIQMGARKVEIEGDALVIIKKCHSTAEDKVEIGGIHQRYQAVRNKFSNHTIQVYPKISESDDTFNRKREFKTWRRIVPRKTSASLCGGFYGP
ncbi:hypothetical protein Godav_011394, partial [Gossypium davidsonii]|nr:hypothetical protein [Gossypium davidsonii]